MVADIFLSVWLVIISALLVRTVSHYNRLTKGITKRGLQEILEAIVAKLQSQQEGRSHIQKIGIVRFNPFADTGGAQSFSIALLDFENNGIVMTSLYARNGNRWYVKEVRLGKGKDVELSREETSAIEKAA